LCAIKIDCGKAPEPVWGTMISLSRNRILIKLFYDLNPRIAPNVWLMFCQYLVDGWRSRGLA
jgi:hypothetical protein